MTWSQDGTDVVDSDSVRVVYNRSSQLDKDVVQVTVVVKQAVYAHTGTYVCRAANAIGTASSNAVVVSVLGEW